jgi:predicted RNase H-like nuclease
LPDSRATGRLPKYNPERKKTFLISDWTHVCNLVASKLLDCGLVHLAQEIQDVGRNVSPRKQDQDCLDACICLIVALYMVKGEKCLMVGNMESGYITVPYGESIFEELVVRCEKTGRERTNWVNMF